jgi:endonuclease-3 related protein
MGKRDKHTRMKLLYEALETALGPLHWWPAETPFEVCIGAILTQNAPWTGVVKAIHTLKERGIFSVDGILASDREELAATVRPTVYYNQKARKLQTFCSFLREHYHGRIEEMGALDPREARRRLLSVSGIGYETADSILLYALGMPVFVVDAYTRRIFLRHGLIDETYGYEELRGIFEEAFAPDPVFYNEYHALLCHVGARFCRRKPDCAHCPALQILGEPTL